MSSVVCQFVCLSGFATLVSPAKMAEALEMPFGLRTRVGPKNHVLDGDPHPTIGKGNFGHVTIIIQSVIHNLC